MNCQAYILCAGASARWKGEASKHLITVEGEPLVRRTVRLFRDLQPCMVYRQEQLGGIAPYELRLVFSECTCDTILQTAHNWPAKVVFLLGDVFYTEALADDIEGVPADATPAFFTDGNDIFAMVFSMTQFHMLREACMNGIKDNTRRVTDGKCWDIYRAFAPEVKQWPLEPEAHPRFARFVTDRTQDFDTEEQYEAFLAGKPKNRLYGNT